MHHDVLELLAHSRRLVPPDALPGTRVECQGRVGGAAGPHHLVLRARIDARRRRHEHLLLDGFRIAPHDLLMLTCPEAACDHSRDLVERWRRFHAQRPRKPGDASLPRLERWEQARWKGHPPGPGQEVPLHVGSFRCVARHSRYFCRTVCPHRAHSPKEIVKTGYDLYEDGQFIGGSWSVVDGSPRPRLQTLDEARAYLLARQMEAAVAVDWVRLSGKASGAKGHEPPALPG